MTRRLATRLFFSGVTRRIARNESRSGSRQFQLRVRGEIFGTLGTRGPGLRIGVDNVPQPLCFAAALPDLPQAVASCSRTSMASGTGVGYSLTSRSIMATVFTVLPALPYRSAARLRASGVPPAPRSTWWRCAELDRRIRRPIVLGIGHGELTGHILGVRAVRVLFAIWFQHRDGLTPLLEVDEAGRRIVLSSPTILESGATFATRRKSVTAPLASPAFWRASPWRYTDSAMRSVRSARSFTLAGSWPTERSRAWMKAASAWS